jgi:hypothetical protein
MDMPHHESDWKGLPGEAAVLDALRRSGVKTGQHRSCYAEGRKAMRSLEMKKKLEEGPAGFMVPWEERPTSVGMMMGAWFVDFVAVSLFVAYLAGRVLAPGTPCLSVFPVAGAAAVLVDAGALVFNSIWCGPLLVDDFEEGRPRPVRPADRGRVRLAPAAVGARRPA